jgi:hypothetical protein
MQPSRDEFFGKERPVDLDSDRHFESLQQESTDHLPIYNISIRLNQPMKVVAGRRPDQINNQISSAIQPASTAVKRQTLQE